jgi:hypothetical protein
LKKSLLKERSQISTLPTVLKEILKESLEISESINLLPSLQLGFG